MTIEDTKRMTLAEKLAARKATIDHLVRMVGIAESALDKASHNDDWSAAAERFVKANQALRESAYGTNWVQHHAAAIGGN